MPELGTESVTPLTARPCLRDLLGGSEEFVTVAELVPWAGAVDDPAGERARRLAADLESDPRIHALSITDNAGGHARLSPEVLAGELVSRRRPVIVHVTCRDRNRSELLSLGWRLASSGIEDLLVLSGDYPSEGYLGVAKPVFDLDSVALLHLLDRLNKGLGGTVVGRTIARDSAVSVEDLAPARGAGAPARTDFFIGVAVNPFKTLERDQLPQYLKLELKVRNGARYAITQIGWDARKLDELRRWVTDRATPVALVASVTLLTRTAARHMASGAVPGIVLPTRLLAVAERESASADKGKAFFLDLTARQIAIARGLGYSGAYIGGASKAEDFARILELADGYRRDDWRDLVASTSFAVPGTWYAYGRDRKTGLNTSRAVAPTQRGSGLLGGPPFDYRVNRFLHDLVFSPESRGAPLMRRFYKTAEDRRLGHPLHVLEQAVKVPLFDCRDCGDCSLPDIAYLCPESQCVKNQRNGPCGGSTAGECEIPGKRCIWARAYGRLAPYGEAMTALERPVVICDNGLRRTSAWGNTFLGRDHATRPPVGTEEAR